MPKKSKPTAAYFDAEEEGICPPLKPAMIRAAEKTLGYRLHAAYLELLQTCNGGYLQRSVFPTTLCPRWADDHVAFEVVMGIGGEEGIDGDVGSQYLIKEWSYPDVGVVISCDGPTAFLLDYSQCGKQGEPRVIWVDVETGKKKPPYVAVLAPDFATFLKQLREPSDN